MKRFAGMAIGLCLFAASSALAQPPPAGGAAPGAGQRAGGPPPMTNLQIIPKETPREQVVATMQSISAALGVQCNYCHVMEGRGGRNDMASDEKPTKKTARADDGVCARDEREAAGGRRQEPATRRRASGA